MKTTKPGTKGKAKAKGGLLQEDNYPSFTVGERVCLLDGEEKVWARSTIVDPEPPAGRNKLSDFIPAHWPCVSGTDLRVITGWDEAVLYPFTKDQHPGENGILRANGMTYKKSMDPQTLQSEKNDFLLYVQAVKADKQPAKRRTPLLAGPSHAGPA